jgi:hypothetical protein
LVRVLSAVIGRVMLTMFHPRQELPLSGLVTFQFGGDDHTGDVLALPQQLAEKSLRGLPVTPRLDQDVQHIPILIHSTPGIIAPTPNGEKRFVQVLLITWSGLSAPELVRKRLPKLAAPLPNRFVRQRDTACKQDLFHIAIAQAEPEMQADGVADDLRREPMTLIGGWKRVVCSSGEYYTRDGSWASGRVNLTMPVEGLTPAEQFYALAA